MKMYSDIPTLNIRWLMLIIGADHRAMNRPTIIGWRIHRYSRISRNGTGV